MADNAISPFGMTGMPGSNTGGTNTAAVPSAGATAPSIGSSSGNPLVPQPVNGVSTPPITSSINTATLPNIFDASNTGIGTTGKFDQAHANQFVDDLISSGIGKGQAELIYNFLANGAGFNSQIAQNLIAALQPGVQRKEADLMEQFSGKGLRGGSPAAIGLGDFLAQEQLNEGQILSQLYEQSVSNYMNVLLGTIKDQRSSSTFDDTMTFLNTMAGINASRNHQ